MNTNLKNQISRWTESQTFFAIFKLPFYISTAVLGFVFEFVYELPFMLVCILSERFQKK